MLGVGVIVIPLKVPQIFFWIPLESGKFVHYKLFSRNSNREQLDDDSLETSIVLITTQLLIHAFIQRKKSTRVICDPRTWPSNVLICIWSIVWFSFELLNKLNSKYQLLSAPIYTGRSGQLILVKLIYQNHSWYIGLSSTAFNVTLIHINNYVLFYHEQLADVQMSHMHWPF